MILVLRKAATAHEITTVCEQLQQMGLNGQTVRNERGVLISVFEDVSTYPSHLFNQLPAVDKVLRISPQLSLITDDRLGAVRLTNGTVIGGQHAIVIAGPCSVEGRNHILDAARKIKQSGAHMLRGGAFKPRTSPYDFQGLGEEALKYLGEAREETGLAVISEVMAAEHVEVAAHYIDILQVGARNMYNYELLKEIGRSGLPVMLKRGLSATINEWLSAAEYIILQGNSKIILCERGIRTFETHTRNTLDLSAVAALKGLTRLPVLVDPSHASGRPELVRRLSRAAIACGADGLMIEVHDDPSSALSDGEQAIGTEELRRVITDVQRLEAVFPKEPPLQEFIDPLLFSADVSNGSTVVGTSCCGNNAVTRR